MTRDEFDTLGIAAQCRRPEPQACYERLTSYGQPEVELCLRCPVASWVTAIVSSSRWTNESDSFGGTGLLSSMMEVPENDWSAIPPHGSPNDEADYLSENLLGARREVIARPERFEPDALKQIDKTIASIQEVRVTAKAA